MSYCSSLPPNSSSPSSSLWRASPSRLTRASLSVSSRSAGPFGLDPRCEFVSRSEVVRDLDRGRGNDGSANRCRVGLVAFASEFAAVESDIARGSSRRVDEEGKMCCPGERGNRPGPRFEWSSCAAAYGSAYAEVEKTEPLLAAENVSDDSLDVGEVIGGEVNTADERSPESGTGGGR